MVLKKYTSKKEKFLIFYLKYTSMNYVFKRIEKKRFFRSIKIKKSIKSKKYIFRQKKIQ